MFDFLNNIVELLTGSLDFVIKFVLYVFKFVIWIFAYLIKMIASIFPNTPFDVSEYLFGIEEYIGYLNWIVPINSILNITMLWGGCMILYYGYGVVMRWLKLID